MPNRRLLLISASVGELVDFIRKPPSELALAFVPSAADPYEKPIFVDNDRQKLQNMGFTLYEFDIKNRTPNELTQILSKVDILYVAGGNSFYLLEKLRASGLDRLLPTYLDAGLLYVGASAGAVVVGPDIEPVGELDDRSQAIELQSTRGFALVPFVPLPHLRLSIL